MAVNSIVCALTDLVANKVVMIVFIGIRVIAPVLSVAIYIIIPFVYKKSKEKICVIHRSASQNEFPQKQRRLMITLGLSSFFTFIFVILPYFFLAWAVHSSMMSQYNGMLIPVMSVLRNFNACMNIFLFTMRHRDIKTGLIYFFKCKELPLNYEQNLRQQKQLRLKLRRRISDMIAENIL